MRRSTSNEAFEGIRDKLNVTQQKVYDFYRKNPKTCAKEMQDYLLLVGHDIRFVETCRKRIHELIRAGRLYISGIKIIEGRKQCHYSTDPAHQALIVKNRGVGKERLLDSFEKAVRSNDLFLENYRMRILERMK